MRQLGRKRFGFNLENIGGIIINNKSFEVDLL